MYSGSAVIDEENVSGLGNGSTPPMLFFYPAAGDQAPQRTGYTQNLAYSTDGGATLRKYDGNPILPQVVFGNRDPKIVRDPVTGRWIMALYLRRESALNHFALFFSSDLLHWQQTQELVLPGSGECPDFFPLPVDGNAHAQKWVFLAADGHYLLGDFIDGRFLPSSGPHGFSLQGERTLYAPQTWYNLPDGRRIQISWLRGDIPSTQFNQCMSLPVELLLRTFADGVRLCAQPVEELTQLRTGHRQWKATEILPMGLTCELAEAAAEISMTFASSATLRMEIRGLELFYDPENGVLRLGTEEFSIPVLHEQTTIRMIVDRTSMEFFSSRGRVYLGKCVLFDPDRKTIVLHGQSVGVKTLDVWTLCPAAGSL